MRKAKLLLFLGAWTAVLPYLGFPYFLKNILFTLSGLTLILLGYVLYKKSGMGESKKAPDSFYENGNNA